MTRLSVSVVSWNTRDLLRQCLQSLFANLDGIDAEVIVVDNASDDGSADMVAIEFPQVVLIRQDFNGGFAQANNAALAASAGKYFLLLNSDTIVHPGAIRHLVDFMEFSPAAGAVAPKLHNPDGSLQRSCSTFPSSASEFYDALYLSKLLPSSKRFGGYAMSHWDFESTRDVDFAGGSCLMLRRSALDQVGALDEDYFMYTEEADLCYRLKEAGWRIVFLPDAHIVHIGGQSSRRVASRMAVQLPMSRYRFIRKFKGARDAAMFKAAVALGSLLRILVWSPMWLAWVGRRNELQQRLKTQRALVKWALLGGSS